MALAGLHVSCAWGGRFDSGSRNQVLNVQWKGVDRLLADLRKLQQRAIPHGMRNALNSSAFRGRELWQEEMKRTFILRNQYTTRSVLVVKATGTKLDSMHAILGSAAPYMGTQEDGGTVRGKHGHKPIPGPVAAGQPAGSQRTRLVRAARRLSAIKAARARQVPTRQQRNAIALSIARRGNQKFALLERPKGGKGLFLVGGGKRKTTARLLWDVSRSAVRVRPHPTLERALQRLQPELPRIYEEKLVEQLRRHSIGNG